MSTPNYSPARNMIRGISNNRQFILPAFFLLMMAVLSLVLISEMAGFLNTRLDIPYWKAIIYACLIELVSIVFIELLTFIPKAKKNQGLLYFFRKLLGFMLLGIFIFVVGTTSLNSVSPVLEKDNIASADKLKLGELQKSVDAHAGNVAAAESAVAAVKGQPQNSAMRANDLSRASAEYMDAIARKEAFLQNLRPDAKLESTSAFTIALMVFLRVLLQSANWLLALVFGKIVKNKFFNPNPAKPHGYTPGEKSDGRVLAFPGVDSVSGFTNRAISHEHTGERSDMETKRANTRLQNKDGQGNAKKTSQQFVLEVYPSAKCEQNGNIFEIVLSGAILGSGKNSPLAWADAYVNVIQDMGRRA